MNFAKQPLDGTRYAVVMDDFGNVPLYQMLLHVSVALPLLFLAIYGPMFWSKRWPKLVSVIGGGIGLVLLGGIYYAVLVGHWPFRG